MSVRIELDWAGDVAPETTSSDDVQVRVIAERGPAAGWPVIEVTATDGQALWAWLRDAYGCDDDDASELASMAYAVA